MSSLDVLHVASHGDKQSSAGLGAPSSMEHTATAAALLVCRGLLAGTSAAGCVAARFCVEPLVDALVDAEATWDTAVL